MDITNLIILFAAAIAGGFCNAIAGGGTFFTFPALTGAGLTPLIANSTNSLGSFFSPLAAIIKDIRKLKAANAEMISLSISAILGGFVGGLLLKLSSELTFRSLIPWLIGFATALFALSPYIKELRKHKVAAHNRLLLLVIIFFVTIYSGYFGAGQGVILMAFLTIFTNDDMVTTNLRKNYIATLANLSALIVYIFSGMIDWSFGAVMIIGALIGGYIGGRFANVISAKILRVIVTITGVLLTLKYSLF